MAIIRSSKNKKGTRSTHYDTSGNKVLSSYRSSSGRIKHYDKNGRYLGSTREGGYGHVYHYDDHGNKVGVTHIKPSGSVRHYPIAQKRDSDDDRYDSYQSENTNTSSYYSSSYSRPVHIEAQPETSKTNTWTQADDTLGCLAIIAAFIVIVFLIT